MPDCGVPLPCESTISSNSDALTITNSGGGGAIKAESNSNTSVTCNSADGFGILGVSNSNHGVRGISSQQSGVFGTVMGASGLSPDASGVGGDSGSAPGVVGRSASSFGVLGRSASSAGVVGRGESQQAAGDSEGVIGFSSNDVGVLGITESSSLGVFGQSSEGTGVYGWAGGLPSDVEGAEGVRGVVGVATVPGDGVVGAATRGAGVAGDSAFGIGVLGTTSDAEGFVGVAVEGRSLSEHETPNNIGVRGFAGNSGAHNSGVVGSVQSGPGSGIVGFGRGEGQFAGTFFGDVEVTGSLTKGGGGFKIDHPLDPANKYFSHAFVESPERKNVYDGIVALDGDGEGSVELPDWFEALNGDFRYQLTAVGQPAPGLHVAREILKNRFTIAGGKPGAKVSWQVTGIRKDAWAQAHPLAVQEDKPSKERGRYQHPECYHEPPENSTFWKGNAELMRAFEGPQQASPYTELQQILEQVTHLGEKIERHKGQQQDSTKS